jgi:hypothetical protein
LPIWNVVLSTKSAGLTPWRGAPKFRKSFEDGSWVLGIGPDEYAQIFRRARLSMDPKGVAADQQVLNGMRVKSLEKVFEILGHHRLALS